MEKEIIDDFTDEDKVDTTFNYWDIEKDNEIIGYFDRFESDDNGEHPVLTTEENKEVHLPSLIVLNTRLRKAEKGNKVKIVYVGDEKAEKSGRTYKNFNIFIK